MIENYYEHTEKVERIRNQILEAHKSNQKISFVRISTNSTRDKSAQDAIQVGIGNLNQILTIDADKQLITVEPGVSMDKLVDFTLKHGRIPAVVPEFPGITVGGAIQGGALESTSFRFGQLNNICTEFEVVLADGSHIIATPENEYADLFWGMSTSYGTLGLLTKVTLQLFPAKKYVNVTIHSHKSKLECSSHIFECTRQSYDCIEGLLFSKSHAATVVGSLSDTPSGKVCRFARNIDPWYWRCISKLSSNSKETSISIPIRDYLFRHDRGAFWMGEYLFPIFGLPSTRFTCLLFAPFMRTRKLYDGLHALKLQHEYVIQDFYMDEKDMMEILDCNERDLEIYPVWLCPILSSTKPEVLSSHYRDSERMLLNVGIYGQPKSHDAVASTKQLEQIISSTPSSRKMLYAQTFYSQSELWDRYDQNHYKMLRGKYKAVNLRSLDGKLLINQERIKPKKLQGILKVLIQTLRGRNVVWW